MKLEHKDNPNLTYQAVPLVEVKFAELNADGNLQFEGYGSVFNILDRGGDVIVKGAFKESLKSYKKDKQLPPMFYNHGRDVLGMIPIGKWALMEEDDHGLKVQGEMYVAGAPDSHLGLINRAFKDKQIKGLSIGYVAKEWDPPKKVGDAWRTIKKVDLWELSLVNFPMNTESTVKVKNLDKMSTRELEAALRDGVRFSQSEAKRIASLWKPEQRDAATADDVKRMADELATLNASFTNKGN